MEKLSDNIAKLGAPWKAGNELLPFHPSASHVPPDYRDGWNACYLAMLPRMRRLEAEVLPARLAAAQPAAGADELLLKVREAVSRYYEALDRREHGGVAQNRAFNEIEEILGMVWRQGDRG